MTYKSSFAMLSLVGVLALGACATEPPPSADTQTQQAPRDAAERHLDHTHGHPSTATDGKPAETVAGEVVAAWSDRDLPYAAWWAGLEPLMNAQGHQDYSWTDPTAIPVLHVTGRPRSPSEIARGATVAAVVVPTSIGRITVQLARPSASAGWLAHRLDLPALPVGDQP